MNSKAFTFFELLLVIAIIAILSVILVPKITGSLRVSKVKALTNDLSIVNSALKTFCEVQESNAKSDCLLNDAFDNNLINKEMLINIVKDDVLDHFSVEIYSNDPQYTLDGYGTIFVKYPTKKNGKRADKYGINISSLKIELLNLYDFTSYISQGNLADFMFIYDVNNNSKIDDEIDILISCSFFKLNESHNHWYFN